MAGFAGARVASDPVRTRDLFVSQHDRQAIEARLDERLAQLRRTREAARREEAGMREAELSHVDNHPGDEGTETHEHEIEVSTEVYLDEEERRIEEARRALRSGSYGTCAECGRQIPPERLEAMPEAIRCVDCQRRLEGVHRQRSSR
jgi:RNA polymerase-binding transcription factor DksA